MKTQSVIDRLRQKALRSPCRHRVAAIGMNRSGTPIAIATNIPRFSRLGGSQHAEMRILRMCPKSLVRIIVARVGKDGRFKPIDPCAVCSAKAAEVGVTIETVPEE